MGNTSNEIADALLSEESWRQILSSLVICYFGREVYSPEMVLKTLKLVGYELTLEQLSKIGGEVLKTKYKFKTREGFNPKELRIPKRILNTISPAGQISEESLSDIVQSFYKKMDS